MKKIFLFALAAVALVACKKSDDNKSSDDPSGDKPVVVFKSSSVSVEVGKTVTLDAAVTPSDAKLTWEVDKPAIASVANGVVTGVTEGNAIVTVTASNEAGSSSAKCIVNVVKQGGGDVPRLLGDSIWPIYLDGEIREQNAKKVVFDFSVDNNERHLYIWESTYVGGTASGKNYFQTQTGGGFLCFNVSDKGWSGLGFSISDAAIVSQQALNKLVADINANPSQYHFHMAIKSTDSYGHYFSLFGLGAADAQGLKWAVGDKYKDVSMYKYDITRDGSWQVIDFSFDKFIVPLGTYQPLSNKGTNYFVAGTEAVQGAALNIDAIYIYKVNSAK